MAKDCGCGVMQASGDPNGRSISNLGGLGRVKKAPKGGLRCGHEKSRKGRKKWVCRDDKGRVVKPPKKTRRKR